MIKKISIVGTVGVPASYGGFETCAEQLCINFMNADLNTQVLVYCSAKHYAHGRPKSFANAILKYIPIFNANGWQSIFYDAISIMHSVFIFKANTIFVMGISGSWILPLIRLFSNVNIVLNLDGVEWKRAKWSKLSKLFLWSLEVMAINFSTNIIADNIGMKNYIDARYNKDSIFIPYGGDHINIPQKINEEIFKKYHVCKNQYCINISRIEPENNNELILEAFSELEQEKIVMIGDWSNNKYSIDLYKKYKDYENIILLPAMFDKQVDKNILRANAKYYIHGHSVGGTSPALVEALCLERKVICFDVIFNRHTTFDKALYFKNKNDLKNCLLHPTNYDQSIMVDINKWYTWKQISTMYLKFVK